MKKLICITILLLSSNYLYAQYSNNVWCFGDSAGMKFINAIPTNFTTGVKSRGSCVSIANSNDSLLFYAFTYGTVWYKDKGKIFNKQHLIMQNGDSIAGQSWYQEMVIVPIPTKPNKFYLFSAPVTVSGLFYSEIDMSLNNGLGAITQKNIQLSNKVGNDCLTAVKHGNGRDWWLIFRSSVYPTDTNDIYYLYLIDSNGINPPIIEHAGIVNGCNGGTITFNPKGNQFVRLLFWGVIELFDFDRCTGTINSNNIIEYKPLANPFNYYWFSAFSPSGRYLYVSESDKPTYLYQYDLQAANVTLSKITIDSFPEDYCGGGLKLAPDGKIYMSTRYTEAACGYFPYCDTTYNMYNMNLSVINEPDSAGLACNFTKYSYYLGGNRTYMCLPNNPDYDLPGDSGCSNVSIPPAPQRGEQQLHATYISAWVKLFVNASGLKGKKVTVSIYDGRGSLKFEVRGLKSNAGYFTLDVDCSGWSDGLYVVHLQTEKEVLSKKFVKE